MGIDLIRVSYLSQREREREREREEMHSAMSWFILQRCLMLNYNYVFIGD